MYQVVWCFFLLICRASLGADISVPSAVEQWTGRWFPDKTTESPTPARHHNIPMGVYNVHCDNAEINLEVDWLDDPIEYTCYSNKADYIPNSSTRPLYEIQNVPAYYHAAHACMNESLTYDEVIPTFGTHRPLWPVWGEYRFVPPQRWIHNLEHGGIVMLYHPCANHREVDKLRSLVTSCLYRHVISPYNLLTPERPFALVAWGSRLQMSKVSKKVVIQFIKEAALLGPEHTFKDGQYKHELIKHSEIITDESDSILCHNL